jgi:formate-dependent nitrite reductase membrane component NrfD
LYQGYERWDNIVTSFAGLCALGIALFATTQISDIDCAVCFLPACKARVWTHYISAALFFTTLSYVSFCLFTKSKGPKTKRKIVRNIVFRTCAVVMLVSIILILLIKVIPWLGTHLAKFKPVFWLEWLALIAFGVSWLVKGKAMLADSKR